MPAAHPAASRYSPRGGQATLGFSRVAEVFGAGFIAQMSVVFVAPPGAVGGVLTPAVFDAAHAALASFCVDGVGARDVGGLVWAGGPVPLSYVVPCLAPGSPAASSPACREVRAAAAQFISRDGGATYATVTLPFDPFGTAGFTWIRGARATAARVSAAYGGVGIYISGSPPTQMDAVGEVFESFGGAVAVTLAVCFVVVGAAFRSLVVPLRCVATIALTLAITFGLATLVYERGALNFMGFPALHGDGVIWTGPVLVFSLIVGFGLGARAVAAAGGGGGRPWWGSGGGR